MSRVVVESNDLREWGEVLITFGHALAARTPTRLAAVEIQKIGERLRDLADSAPFADEPAPEESK